jgi:hypothetical protein
MCGGSAVGSETGNWKREKDRRSGERSWAPMVAMFEAHGMARASDAYRGDKIETSLVITINQ